jgi:N-acetylmuramoyl-L-alanine amidase
MKKIALVVGHRSRSQGAYGNMGISEWIFNSDLAKEIVDEADDIDVDLKIFYRRESGHGYTQRMKTLHKEIDAWGADISVSLHFNASSHASANGHEVLHCAFSSTSAKYAALMNSSFTKHLNNKDRGVKPKSRKDRGGGFLCRGRSYCILVEPFFASHQNEYIQGQRGREELINSFIEFFENVK